VNTNSIFFGLSSLFGLYDYQDKQLAQTRYLQYMLNRTCRIFEYENLPETMPHRYLEMYLQCNGHVCVAEHEGNLYAFFGGWGGEPDAYYLPTQYVVANPYLGLNKVYNVGVDCIVVPNDSMYVGLLPLFKRYASLMVENDLSMKMADVNARIAFIMAANDDVSKDSALKYLERIEHGDNGVIGQKAFLDGIDVNPIVKSGHDTLSSLIEFQQYLKASWFNEMGLQANYNMKREAINSDEAQLNDDMLLPLVDDMYQNRVEFFDKVNEMFGTDIRVKFSSAWEDNRIELEAEQNQIISEYSETVEDETVEDETVEDETVEDETVEDVLEGIEDDLERIAEALEGGENEVND